MNPYQMVLHRPVETTGVFGNFDSADFKLTHHRRFKVLDTPRIIKEEQSSAQRRVPRDRTWSLPQVGTEYKCIDTKTHATLVSAPRQVLDHAYPNASFQTVYVDAIYQTESIAYRGSNLSPFLRISWNQMPGGGGTPEKAPSGPSHSGANLFAQR